MSRAIDDPAVDRLLGLRTRVHAAVVAVGKRVVAFGGHEDFDETRHLVVVAGGAVFEDKSQGGAFALADIDIDDYLVVQASRKGQQIVATRVTRELPLDKITVRAPVEAVSFSDPTGTVSFLFTDIEGSTRLWENWSSPDFVDTK